MLSYLLEDLTGKDDHGGGAIADLGVLGPCDVDEDAGCGVDDVEKLAGKAGSVSTAQDMLSS